MLKHMDILPIKDVDRSKCPISLCFANTGQVVVIVDASEYLEFHYLSPYLTWYQPGTVQELKTNGSKSFSGPDLSNLSEPVNQLESGYPFSKTSPFFNIFLGLSICRHCSYHSHNASRFKNEQLSNAGASENLIKSAASNKNDNKQVGSRYIAEGCSGNEPDIVTSHDNKHKRSMKATIPSTSNYNLSYLKLSSLLLHMLPGTGQR
ncbi:hypothetical protein Hypma_010530 [Hypsizygus marmoreus]|uniref:Uncharacterized protein n=1 Tax=Hypsizygus marmoreus TaxID=39966 RepID=A0A369JJF1_HYPMA|nr:hypothetical protein Hypma_010530 [Hypsizygus marmoreus]